jgi:Na+-translocating ferredoxin:NAD+ oxidoreductase RNF subunit RnfB
MKKIPSDICACCGEPIFFIPTKAKNIILRTITNEERKKKAWRHADGFIHCKATKAKAKPKKR